MRKKYTAIRESDNSYPTEYDVSTRSAMTAAKEIGRCEGGEKIAVVDPKTGRTISEVRYTTEGGGHYYRVTV